MKELLIFLILLCFNCCPLPPHKDATLTKIGQSSVALLITKDENTGAFCSGTFVSDNLILTAAHCVNYVQETTGNDEPIIRYLVENEAPEFKHNPTITHRAVVIKQDTLHDLALLQIVGQIPNHQWLPIAKYNPAIGDTLTFVGNPRGWYFTYLFGTVSQFLKSFPNDENDLSYIEVNSSITFGNSGGAAVNKQGEIVGVADAILPGRPNASLCIDLQNVRKFLF